tara:strand:- start:1004 stop:1216 length:213 start_codon:yes stop_codon:yes gene_type:complete
MNSAGIGVIFVIVGISFSAYHFDRIMSKAPKLHYIFGIIFGVLCINVGSNLIADGITSKFNLNKAKGLNT